MSIRSWWLTYTPESTSRDPKLITAWCRLHRVDPDRCFLVRLFPRLHVAAFGLYDVDADGNPFLRDGEPGWHWTLRLVRLPLSYELSVESWELPE